MAGRRLAPGQWLIGMSAWIIQDGNYGDFAVNQRAEFAVEFYDAEPLVRSDAPPPAAVSLADGAWYEVSTTVTAARQNAWVIDLGIQAYREQAPPPDIEVGCTAVGVVYLGVDPFPYFERLANLPDMPALVYTWDILGTRRLVTGSDDASELKPGHDRPAARLEPIEKTDAWHDDDGGVAEYLLLCQLVDLPAKRTSATST